MTEEQIAAVIADRDTMKARAVALLNLLDDIHNSGLLNTALQKRALDALNDTHWVDE